MTPEEKKARRKRILRTVVKGYLPSIIGGGIGYGVGRTVADRVLSKPGMASKVNHPAMRYGVMPALSLVSAYAGHQVNKRIHALREEPEKKASFRLRSLREHLLERDEEPT